MKTTCLIMSLTFAICIGAILTSSAGADEGMWLFNNPPRDYLEQKHDFSPAAAWLEHLQKSSVRFNSGGSGSFVSAEGLLMTNHHVGADALQKLSTPEHNLVTEGFCAPSREEELKCVDLELNVLLEMEDVTSRVKAAVKPRMSPADAEQARRGAMNTIEQESLQKTGLRSDVVTLYRGGMYHLYRYKKYTDVRLVFAPEQAIAFFGGDPDNFEYPRYDLDICFFRAYEDGKPVRVEHYLRWSPEGPKDGELVFVSGHPGRTSRLNTVAHLEFIRDLVVPFALNYLRRKEVLLSTFSERSRENARRAQDELFGVQNSRKAYLGELAGLQDPAIIHQKREEENRLREAVGRDEKLARETGDPWQQVADTLVVWRRIYTPQFLLERGAALDSQLFSIARTLVRLAEETARPNAERLREYRESNLESLKQELFSEAPIYEDLEMLKLADSLGLFMELAGPDHEILEKVLAGKSPQARAAELVQGTKLKDVALRKELAEGGREAIRKSDDPMIRLALAVDPAARHYRKTYEAEVEEPQRQAYAKIADARFALYGTNVYPDATFTLRLAFGTVKGYQQDGRPIRPWTAVGGAYQRAAEHGNEEPFALPESWLKHKDRLNLQTPLNFVSTADIIGGNSGSPVVNRHGELVGIIFDGNLQSLVWDYVYDAEQGRAIAVHSAGIVEALKSVYRADTVLEELGR